MHTCRYINVKSLRQHIPAFRPFGLGSGFKSRLHAAAFLTEKHMYK